MAKARVEIRDAKRTESIKQQGGGYERKSFPAYRVMSRAANGEPLQTSEVLNDPKAVWTHLKAMMKLWSYAADRGVPPNESSAYPVLLEDVTKAQSFAKSFAKKRAVVS